MSVSLAATVVSWAWQYVLDVVSIDGQSEMVKRGWCDTRVLNAILLSSTRYVS